MSDFIRPRYCAKCGMLLPLEHEGDVCPDGCILPALAQNKTCKHCGHWLHWKSEDRLCDSCRTMYSVQPCSICHKDIPFFNPLINPASALMCEDCRKKTRRPTSDTCSVCFRPLDKSSLDLGFPTCPVCRAHSIRADYYISRGMKLVLEDLKKLIGPICVTCQKPVRRNEAKKLYAHCPRCRKRQLLWARRKQYDRVERDLLRAEGIATTVMLRRKNYGYK